VAQIFLCHASEDKAHVREVYHLLRAIEGFEPWLDEEGVAGVIAGFFTVVGWPKSLLFGQGSGRFVTAVKSMIVSGRIS